MTTLSLNIQIACDILFLVQVEVVWERKLAEQVQQAVVKTHQAVEGEKSKAWGMAGGSDQEEGRVTSSGLQSPHILESESIRRLKEVHAAEVGRLRERVAELEEQGVHKGTQEDQREQDTPDEQGAQAGGKGVWQDGREWEEEKQRAITEAVKEARTQWLRDRDV